MSTKVDRIRMYVFKIWFLTLSIVVAVFATKFAGLSGIRPPFPSVFQSLQMRTGLVIPQIGVMVAFYFNLEKQKDKIESLSDEQTTVIKWMSLFYHFIFIVAVIFGVGFYGFDQHADGNALERNTAAVVAIMGLFSVFLLPVAFLFAKPRDTDDAGAVRSQSQKEVAASDGAQLRTES